MAIEEPGDKFGEVHVAHRVAHGHHRGAPRGFRGHIAYRPQTKRVSVQPVCSGQQGQVQRFVLLQDPDEAYRRRLGRISPFLPEPYFGLSLGQGAGAVGQSQQDMMVRENTARAHHEASPDWLRLVSRPGDAVDPPD